MRSLPITRLCGLLASATAIAVLVGCSGSNGSTGATGASGAVSSVSTLTTAEWQALKLKGSVTNLDMNGGQPIVTFKVTDAAGTPLPGLAGADPAGFTQHMGFSIAKLVSPANPTPSNGNTMPTYWVNYEFVKPPASATAAPTVTAFPDPEYVAANLTDNGDGTYVYKFNYNLNNAVTYAATAAASFTGNQALADLGDLSYAASDTFRMLVLVGGAPTSQGTVTHPAPAVLTPLNLTYDFVGSAPNTPIAAPRDIVDVSACNQCHSVLSMHANYMAPVQDTHACVVCHTDQMKFGNAEARATATTLNSGTTAKLDGRAVPMFPNFIHKIHMGNLLSLTNYSFYGTPINGAPLTQFPQDVRNCNTCHTGTAAPSTPATVSANGSTGTWPAIPPIAPVTTAGENWNLIPGQAACGACHDTTIFASNTNHGTGITANYTDDSKCGTCHTSADIQVAHWPIYGTSTPNNTSTTTILAGNPATMPNHLSAGTAHTLNWVISKVAVIANPATNGAYCPQVTFAFYQDNSSTITPVQANGSSTMVAGFASSPMLKILMNVPQDGITSPSDYNYITSGLSVSGYWAANTTNAGPATAATAGTAITGTLGSGMINSDGSFTVTLTGVNVPSTTNMLMAVLGYQFMTENGNLGQDASGYNTYTNGLILNAPTVSAQCTSFANTTAGTTRRTILKPGACLSCHENLGLFTNSNFHSGNYSNPDACLGCHNPNATDHSGGVWSINTKEWIHGIHSGGLASATALVGSSVTPRVNAYTNHVASTFWNIQYPALLNDCEQCHEPGSYNFALTANQGQVPNLLWDTVASGTVYSNGNQGASNTGLLACPTPGTVPGAFSTVAPKTSFMSPGGAADASLSTLVGSTPPASIALGSLYSAASGSGTPYTITPSPAGGGTYVTSPITAACSSCHDSTSAISHYGSNGGVFYATRTQSMANGKFKTTESCLVCHGAGGVEDAQTVHMNFK